MNIETIELILKFMLQKSMNGSKLEYRSRHSKHLRVSERWQQDTFAIFQKLSDNAKKYNKKKKKKEEEEGKRNS